MLYYLGKDEYLNSTLTAMSDITKAINSRKGFIYAAKMKSYMHHVVC